MLTINARLTIVIFFFLLNCAFLLTQIMSNGIFKSPVHRAVTNTEKERISLAMFHGLDPDKEIEPAAALLNEKQPGRYRTLKAKEYLAGFFEHFCQGTRFIESVKI